MASLYVQARAVGDGSRRYDVKYRRGGRYFPVEHAGTFKTRREALIRKGVVGEWLAAGLNPRVELRRRTSVVASNLESVAEAWLASRRSLTDNTRAGHRFRLPTILDGFKSVAADEITVEDVNTWVGKLTARYKPGTVRLFVQQLRMILDYADLPANPARSRRVELPRDVRREPDPPTAEMVAHLLSRLRDEFVLPVLVMELGGLRVSEALALEQDDVIDAAIRVRREVSKGQQKGRIVPVPETLTDALQDRLKFSASRDGLATAMANAGGFRPHALRHRRASLWYQQRVGPVELARRLGHSKPSMSLDTYAHVKPLHELPSELLARLLS